ncbi:uncharacterized protein SCHCODRAFT_02625663 [Schizophyllum commune H4-8]|uniref:uncharacterized protein n=1 Tax=Schizophyllum commune (strain H4-8 / FGSC 9210) TaxID=578458 RepID=UPI002160661D|nr:uncharacterized protein SCHCODRAFT_02625663 [Schizophyllum commune H4-8]KAI5892248.1 hypothetical protein SCHCODRAFT_02625663 [Schizophyllum commune H4-8]
MPQSGTRGTLDPEPTPEMAEEGISGTRRPHNDAELHPAPDAHSVRANEQMHAEGLLHPGSANFISETTNAPKLKTSEAEQTARTLNRPSATPATTTMTEFGAGSRVYADFGASSGGRATRRREMGHEMAGAMHLSTELDHTARADQPRYTSSAVDYEKKYAPDAHGEELSSNARIWSVYNDEAQIADTELVKGLNGTLDVLMVFAGLFSAVVTTFVAQSSQALNPDYAQMTTSLLYELTRVQRAMATGAPINDIPEFQGAFTSKTYAMTDVWVNGLWLVSLTLSLLTALISVLAKQWIHHFNSITGSTPRDRTYVRQYRLKSFGHWKVPEIIGFLPALLSTALLLFFAGLAVYVAPMNTAILAVIIILSAASFLAYLLTIILPIFVPHCAYKTPTSDYIIVFAHVMTNYVFHYMVLVIRLPYDVLRWHIRHRHRPRASKGCWTPFATFWEYCAPAIPPRVSPRELAHVETQSPSLAIEALLWLCSSPLNASAADISVQAASAFPSDSLSAVRRGYWILHWKASKRLRALSQMIAPARIAEHADAAERLARTMLHVPNEDWYLLKYHIWELRLWENLYTVRQQIASPQASAMLRLALLVRFCCKTLRPTDDEAAQRAARAVDWPMFHSHDLRLHPVVWCQLDRAVRLCLLRLEDRPRWSEFSVEPRWSLTIGYTYVLSEEEGQPYAPPNWKKDLYENTGITLRNYAKGCKWNEGRDRLLDNMKKVKHLLSQHLAQLESHIDLSRSDTWTQTTARQHGDSGAERIFRATGLVTAGEVIDPESAVRTRGSHAGVDGSDVSEVAILVPVQSQVAAVASDEEQDDAAPDITKLMHRADVHDHDDHDDQVGGSAVVARDGASATATVPAASSSAPGRITDDAEGWSTHVGHAI